MEQAEATLSEALEEAPQAAPQWTCNPKETCNVCSTCCHSYLMGEDCKLCVESECQEDVAAAEATAEVAAETAAVTAKAKAPVVPAASEADEVAKVEAEVKVAKQEAAKEKAIAENTKAQAEAEISAARASADKMKAEVQAEARMATKEAEKEKEVAQSATTRAQAETEAARARAEKEKAEAEDAEAQAREAKENADRERAEAQRAAENAKLALQRMENAVEEEKQKIRSEAEQAKAKAAREKREAEAAEAEAEAAKELADKEREQADAAAKAIWWEAFDGKCEKPMRLQPLPQKLHLRQSTNTEVERKEMESEISCVKKCDEGFVTVTVDSLLVCQKCVDGCDSYWGRDAGYRAFVILIFIMVVGGCCFREAKLRRGEVIKMPGEYPGIKFPTVASVHQVRRPPGGKVELQEWQDQNDNINGFVDGDSSSLINYARSSLGRKPRNGHLQTF